MPISSPRPLLAEIGERLGLATRLAVAPNEARAGVKLLPTVLADTMEAVIRRGLSGRRA